MVLATYIHLLTYYPLSIPQSQVAKHHVELSELASVRKKEVPE